MNRIVRCIVAGAAIVAAPAQVWAICATNSFVNGTVSQTSAGVWTYFFSVQNGCAPNHQQLMTDFYLPYFSDANIGNITVPGADNTSMAPSSITWSATIEANNNVFGLPNAGVIDFHVTVSPEIQVLPGQPEAGVGYYGTTGFSFTANYGAVEGPFEILQTAYDGGAYDQSQTVTGDPPIPGSPLALAALSTTATPEPGTLGLFATGMFGLGAMVRRRRRA